jgi:uncharacterized protein involved in response to NO
MKRDDHTPPVLRLGFRPLFFGAAVWSAVAMALWLPLWSGEITLPAAFDPLGWHVHEMLFGYAAAVVAGFLLTAIPNWTGRLPIAGWPLGGLVALWLAGRAAMLLSGAIGPALAALIDLAFPLAFLAVVAREILAGRNWRNLPMLLALAALALANAAMHADALGLVATDGTGRRLGVATLALLIGLVGGRIVPSFTRNWLARRGDKDTPPGFDRFDRAAMLLTAAALAGWIGWPDSPVAGTLLVVAGAAGFARLARWRGQRAGAEPLVWSLHLGFAWLPAGLLLTGLAPLAGLPAAAGIHALTAGAIGAMTLAVMTRASLGHSGRPLAADRATTAIYLLIHAAALLRVGAAFAETATLPLLWASAAAWIAAFALFAVHYGPLLLARGRG